MTVTYDVLPRTLENIDYVSGATDTALYPDSNNINVFGPLWLPRIYGKDLTSFEIASSGKIAITINDIHALDISSSNQKTSLTAKSNDSFEINVNSNSMFMTFDATNENISLFSTKGSTSISASNDVSITASNNVDVTSCNNVNMTAYKDVAFKSTVGAITLGASNDTMTMTLDSATNNITVASTIGSTTINSAADIVETASSNITFNAGDVATFQSSNNMYLESVDSNVYISAANEDMSMYFVKDRSGVSTITIASITDISTTAGNDYSVTAQNNLNLLTTGLGTMTLAANTDQMTFVLDGSTNTTSLYSSNDINLSTLNDVNVSAHDSNVSLKLGDSNMTMYTVSNIEATASNNVNVKAKNNILMTACNGTFDLYANTSKTFITMDSSNILTAYGSNGVVINTSNSFVVRATSNINMLASNGDLALYAESNVYVSADKSNMTVTMDRNGDVISIYSLSNIKATACNAFAIDSRSNVSITASSNIELYSRSNVLVTSSNNVNISGSNNVYITAQSNLTLAAADMSFALSGNLSYSAQSNISFFIAQSSNPTDATFMVSPDRVNVRGDLWITGSINTNNIINTTVVQETLKINDKNVLLASVGDQGGAPNDGYTTNDMAGIVVDGMPTGETDSNIYKKAVQWVYGGEDGAGGLGMKALGTSNAIAESAWELLGGGMRITHRKADATEVSFTFRVNQYDELELVKRFFNPSADQYQWRAVAKFGKIILPAIIQP
jgi:uncharacterized protein (DUF2345 family)